MNVFKNILDLRNSTVYATSYVESFGTKLGAGGDIFIWDETMDRVGEPEIVGMIVHPQDPGAPALGGYRRHFSGVVTPEDYGAHGDGTESVPNATWQAYYGPLFQSGDTWDTVAHRAMFNHAELDRKGRRVLAAGEYKYSAGTMLPRETPGGDSLNFSYTGGQHTKASSAPGNFIFHDTGVNLAYTQSSANYRENRYFMKQMGYQGGGCTAMRLMVCSNSIVESIGMFIIDSGVLMYNCINSEVRHLSSAAVDTVTLFVGTNADLTTNFSSKIWPGDENDYRSDLISVDHGRIFGKSGADYGVYIRGASQPHISQQILEGQDLQKGIFIQTEAIHTDAWGGDITRVWFETPAGYSDSAVLIRAKGTYRINRIFSQYDTQGPLYISRVSDSVKVVVDNIDFIKGDFVSEEPSSGAENTYYYFKACHPGAFNFGPNPTWTTGVAPLFGGFLKDPNAGPNIVQNI